MLTNQKKTFLLDIGRGSLDGVYQTLAQTVLLLVAVKYFASHDFFTSLIAAAPFWGLIFSLFYTARFSTSTVRKSTLVALPTVLCGIMIGSSALVQDSLYFTLTTSAGMMLFGMRLPFLLGIYEENYGDKRRGVLFSGGLLAMIISSILFNYLFGRILDQNLSFYVWLVAFGGLTGIASGFVVFAMPSHPPRLKGYSNPFSNFRIIKENKAFGYVLFIWFVLGFANLWIKPLRVVYLAEAERGLNLEPMMVLLLIGVIPEVTRLLFTQFWAWLFDRLNFILLRMILNACLAVGLLLFFISDNLWLIGLGSFIHGIGFSGGFLAWNLWVTKFAPPGQAQGYMSVHTFFTGVRGIIGPYLGFLFIRHFTIPQAGMVSCAILVCSILLLVPILKTGKRRNND